MALIKAKDTKPELAVRSILHRMGYRFRIHRKDLPGRPDIVLPKYRVAIFVNGCFWHNHKKCRDGKIPKTDTIRWQEKLARNVIRDKKNLIDLRRAGWKPLVIWECEIMTSIDKVKSKINKILFK
jgi:DNA mismatch endonuclease, patch repair protein